MGLQPLEFSECLTDSPYFRDKLLAHEKELVKTSKAIKFLISQCKDLIQAATNLSKVQRNLSKTLLDFKFECIGSQQTDDEIVIENSLKEFGKLISSIEDERDRMLQAAVSTVVEPLEKFRKEQIGEAKEGKKRFDKETGKYTQSLDRYLNLRLNKTTDNQLLEADASLEMEKKHFYKESMKYVLLLQSVQERKKFEFVEILLQFVHGWLTFYHQGYEVAKDFNPFMQDLTQKLQKCRANFESTKEEAKSLMEKMLEVRGTKPQDHIATLSQKCTCEGYLYLMEKKALTTNWTKFYCQYQKENKILTMIPYHQATGKGTTGMTTDTMVLVSCTRRASDSIDKRFCFDVHVQDRSQTLTLQAISEEDRRLWLDAMDGREPVYAEPTRRLDGLLDDIGFSFIRRCVNAIEARGLEEEGLYRIVGVNSKVTKLTNMLLDRRKADRVSLDELNSEWEMKTITSALKNYFRSLPEPLMTFKLHQKLIDAAKQESRTLRINDIHELIHKLPESNFEMLDILIAHLKRVSQFSDKNLMTVSNLGVCFGPTLMRPEEETVAAIMDIKFCNLVIEILVENYDKIFKTAPEFADVANTRVLNSAKPSCYQQRPSSSITSSTMSISSSQNSAMSSSMISNVGISNSSNTSTLSSRDTTPTRHNSCSSAAGNTRSNIASGTTVTAGTVVMRPTTPRTAGGHVSMYASAVGDKSRIQQSAGSDHHSSASSSCDSLSLKCSSSSMMTSSVHGGPSTDAPYVSRHEHPHAHGSWFTSSMSSGSVRSNDTGRKVRTLYACEAENDSELSFEPNQIITNVRTSREPGWLEGTLDGKTGLIPHNYVEYLN